MKQLSNIWYHASSEPLDGPLKCNWQGIHLAKTAGAARSVLKNRSKKHGYLYKITFPSQVLRPFVVELDPMSWSAKDIATILIANDLDGTVSGACGYPDEEGCQWKDEIIARKVVKSPIELTDSEVFNLYDLLECKDYPEFNKIGQLLEAKGYNCIVYPLAETSLKNSALLFWDNTLLEQCEFVRELRIK